MQIGIWIKAFRLRTLPLALSSTMMASFLAAAGHRFKWVVFIFASLTTIFLQILSNLANDLGDTIHGTDNKNRVGPVRATQSGAVTIEQMKGMIIVFVVLSLISGSFLIVFGLNNLPPYISILFFIVGITAIVAAIKYTIGKSPYGYVGFGDLFVFIFFGIVGVMGTYYLHTNQFNVWVLPPAAAIGLLSSSVLNLNNMRDVINDEKSGKRTLVVRIGAQAAKIYHVSLIMFALILCSVYTIRFYETPFQLLFLLTIPFFAFDINTVLKNNIPLELNDELRKLALITFVFSFTFGLGLVL